MENLHKEHDLIKLYIKFIKDTKNGQRRQKNGTRVRASRLESYDNLRKALINFNTDTGFPLKIRSVRNMKERQLGREKLHWKLFYDKFTDYLYEQCGFYDNYVGSLIKTYRTFINYLNNDCDLQVGNFHAGFYAPSEEIEIITLLPEQLNFLIYNKEFESRLPPRLRITKDMFVFGCTVALRFSDIIRLSHSNLKASGGKVHLTVYSGKTGTKTSVLLPAYAIEIIDRNIRIKGSIFPAISNHRFNHNVKELIRLAEWKDERTKIRKRRGQPVIIYKNNEAKEAYSFCDLVSSHTMRRTAITTMLCLQMPENVVRKISGHAANSKEFYRYVEISQRYSDTETEKLHQVLKSRELALN